MFCPNCGQERLATETSFCSRCGFLLTGVAEILKAGGLIPSEQKEKRRSKLWRNRGFKKGLFIFLLSFVIVPVFIMIAIGLRLGPEVPTVIMILLAGGGILKMIYSLMFETPEPRTQTPVPTIEGIPAGQHGLPPQRSVPVSGYSPPHAGSWRDTNDLVPTSVTEGTTKLFDGETKTQI